MSLGPLLDREHTLVADSAIAFQSMQAGRFFLGPRMPMILIINVAIHMRECDGETWSTPCREECILHIEDLNQINCLECSWDKIDHMGSKPLFLLTPIFFSSFRG